MANQPPLILLVDDEPDIIALYKTKLLREGFQVETAANGAEAIEVVKSKHPDLVLMDVKMPVMDGVAAQEGIRNDPTIKDTKVVFLTAFSDPIRPEVDKAFAKESGALDFIKKGINLDELMDKIRGYLALPQ